MKKLKKVIRYYLFVCLGIFIASIPSFSQTPPDKLWHDKERTLRYRPEGKDFVIENGDRRFNRALYGTNTGFRVEAGDLPEFALYMPGMGGNLQLGLISGDTSKWLIKAQYIKAIYRPGSMLYEIKDDWLGRATLHVHVLAAADREGILIKVKLEKGEPNQVQLFIAFGGATGKRFSRDGDIGADPESSFYLKSENCKDNIYEIKENTFLLSYASVDKDKQKKLSGLLPPTATLRLSNAGNTTSPLALQKSTVASVAPVVTAQISLGSKEFYVSISNPVNVSALIYDQLPFVFKKADEVRNVLANRVTVTTPDPYLNTLSGALSIAGDAIWEDPSYLHGAVAWRMRLNAWRGAYIADPLGWHDRAKKHFSSYALSQLTSPEQGPLVPDTALHFARQTEKLGNTLFSSGYICRNPGGDFRAHHYDMNLVFVDQLLNHFQWDGDIAYVKEMWPLIKRHLAWEKRNFDGDGDGLYDAYCCIWASDALQYSNGGVTHSSSYNYRANQMAAKLAQLLGEDPKPYQQEADKIIKAIRDKLWLPYHGWYAEYKDFSGNQLVHPAAGLWTIYHSIDSNVPDAFEAFQSLRYVDTQIPHIPIKAKGLPYNDLFTLSTTNWLPYTWSINNVAMAEVLHTSLAYWKGGRADEGFHLWKSALIESMYLSASPGGFEQLSFYDAIRGELYRDFADPIGMAGRSLVEGLFGIQPNALQDTLLIRPGLPKAWSYASLQIPDLSFDYKQTGSQDTYTITPKFSKSMNFVLQVRARGQAIQSVLVNGKKALYKILHHAIGNPVIEINAPKAKSYRVVIAWKEDVQPDQPSYDQTQIAGEPISITFPHAMIVGLRDPQQALIAHSINGKSFTANVKESSGDKTVFLKVKQGEMEWWSPVCFTIKKAVEITSTVNPDNTLLISLRNNSADAAGKLLFNDHFITELALARGETKQVNIANEHLVTGTNVVQLDWKGKRIIHNAIHWQASTSGSKHLRTIDLTEAFNDHVTNIFRNQYLSPRPPYPTLQLPWQGIGNWCYPLTDAVIDDTGIRQVAGPNNRLTLPQGIPFDTPGQKEKPNIVYTSQWDNYPDSVLIPLTGNASHAYLLMAGSTNHMQSRFTNGVISIQYKDGTEEQLELRNPETWWPIEQDYYTDGYAFKIDASSPLRVHLKTGLITSHFKEYQSIKGLTNYAIDGGAATVLDLPLNHKKELASIKLKTIANEVVIGLMAVTLAD